MAEPNSVPPNTNPVYLEMSKPTRMHQTLAVMSAAMGAFCLGSVLTYASPSVPLLQNMTEITNASIEDCGGSLSGTLSVLEVSWFSAIVNIGGFIGGSIGLCIVDRIGRRATMLATSVPFVVGWLLIGLAGNLGTLLAGRLLCGLCCGLVMLSVPTYIGEISSPDIRGLLGSAFQVELVCGCLFEYLVALGCCWQWLAVASLVPAAVFVVSMFFCERSPYYLAAQEKDDQARAALNHFRGKNYNTDEEFRIIKTAVDEARQNTATFRDFFLPHNRLPMLIGMLLMVFQQFTGINAILFNMSLIFDVVESGMSTLGSSITVTVVNLVAALVATPLVDRAGRKTLLMVSTSVMCVSQVAMGGYFYLSEQDKDVTNLGWLPLVCLIVFVFFFAIGYGTVPYIMLGELFAKEIRTQGVALASLSGWVLSFIVTFAFQPLREAIGDSKVYWIFAVLNAVDFVFCCLVVKETKGKSLEEIAEMFGRPPPAITNNSSDDSDSY